MTKIHSWEGQAQRRYRAALIGCGAMGQYHARALNSIPEVALVALADPHQPSLDRIADEIGIARAHRHLGIEALFDVEQLDFVVVATQAPQHAAATLVAAAHGVHVLCEKPLALSLDEADSMVAACEQAGVRLAVNHLRRADPAARLARDMIAAGAIGDVVALDIHDKGGRPAGNALMEMATHYFDLARFVLSRRQFTGGQSADDLKWIFAHLSTGFGSTAHRASVEEIVPSQVAMPTDRDCGLVLGERGTVVLGFAGEAQAVARFHNPASRDTRYDGVDIIGTEGSLALRGGTILELYRLQGHTWAEHDLWQSVPVPLTEDDSTTFEGHARSMQREMAAAITQGREHVSTGRDGLIVLEAIMAVYASHRLGRPVTLPLQERTHPLLAWQAEQGALV